MFNIDKLKKEIEWMKSADLTLIDFEEYKITELIQALEESKEIMEHLNKYDFLGTYKAPVEWLSRYFPDTRKEV